MSTEPKTLSQALTLPRRQLTPLDQNMCERLAPFAHTMTTVGSVLTHQAALDPATVRELARDAIITLCVHNGERVTDIKRYTRSYPVAVRLLLEIGPPPDFDGPICIDCGRRYHLQKDHLRALLNGGITELTNLNWRCPHCHKTKTETDLERWRSENGTGPRADQPTLSDRGPP